MKKSNKALSDDQVARQRRVTQLRGSRLLDQTLLVTPNKKLEEYPKDIRTWLLISWESLLEPLYCRCPPFWDRRLTSPYGTLHRNVSVFAWWRPPRSNAHKDLTLWLKCPRGRISETMVSRIPVFLWSTAGHCWKAIEHNNIPTHSPPNPKY